MFRIYSFLAHTQFRKVYKTITQQHPIIVFLYYRVQSQDAICDFEVIQLLLILFALSTKVCYSKWNTSIYNYFLYIWLRYVHRLSLTLPTLTLTLSLSLSLSLHIYFFQDFEILIFSSFCIKRPWIGMLWELTTNFWCIRDLRKWCMNMVSI